MQKKSGSGTEVIRFCVSVRPSPQKSVVTFEPLDRSAQNFQGPLISSQVIFWFKVTFLVNKFLKLKLHLKEIQLIS